MGCNAKNDWNKIRSNLRHRQALREGIPYISKRISKSNNKYMKNYDPTKENKFIMYLDENNLNDWEVSQYLPYYEFQWLRNVDKFDVISISENNSIGYMLEVDLEYPD